MCKKKEKKKKKFTSDLNFAKFLLPEIVDINPHTNFKVPKLSAIHITVKLSWDSWKYLPIISGMKDSQLCGHSRLRMRTRMMLSFCNRLPTSQQ